MRFRRASLRSYGMAHEALPLSLQPLCAQSPNAARSCWAPSTSSSSSRTPIARELAELTGGYVQVPVLLTDDGRVIVESRAICEHLLAGPAGAKLVPAPLEGPIWGYADFVDGPLEDVLFRIASPEIRDAWPSAAERGAVRVRQGAQIRRGLRRRLVTRSRAARFSAHNRCWPRR